MLSTYCPRLSEAKALLPQLRAQLIAAAPRHTLPANISLDLLPILEAGAFGYEIVPDRPTHTYLTIGVCDTGEAVLRRTQFAVDTSKILRLATVDGALPARSEFRLSKFPRQREYRFANVFDAVEFGLSQLTRILPGTPRKPMEFRVSWHRCLDEALEIAHTHLSAWNPFIHFFGVPLEDQFGFALRGDHGEHGELVSRRPDMWVLRWKSSAVVIYEEWEVTPPQAGAASGWVHT